MINLLNQHYDNESVYINIRSVLMRLRISRLCSSLIILRLLLLSVIHLILIKIHEILNEYENV